ncbi:MAG TPA: hypothetical protein VIW26_10710 [Gemmatimonadales bacterium]|jgi:hypothetical protein
MIGFLVGAALWGASFAGGFIPTKRFVRNRLRYVDSAQKPGTAIAAGVVGTAAGIAIAALPIITVPMGVLFGIGVGTGWAGGQNSGTPPDA